MNSINNRHNGCLTSEEIIWKRESLKAISKPTGKNFYELIEESTSMEKEKFVGDNCKDCMHNEVCKYKEFYYANLEDLANRFMDEIKEVPFTVTLSCNKWEDANSDIEEGIIDPNFREYGSN